MMMKINENGIIRYATPEEEEMFNLPVSNPEGHISSISARQFKLMLYEKGIYESVVSWVNTQDIPVKIAFENSSVFSKDDPMMLRGLADLGFTSEDIDIFFKEASLI